MLFLALKRTYRGRHRVHVEIFFAKEQGFRGQTFIAWMVSEVGLKSGIYFCDAGRCDLDRYVILIGTCTRRSSLVISSQNNNNVSTAVNRCALFCEHSARVFGHLIYDMDIFNMFEKVADPGATTC